MKKPSLEPTLLRDVQNKAEWVVLLLEATTAAARKRTMARLVPRLRRRVAAMFRSQGKRVRGGFLVTLKKSGVLAEATPGLVPVALLHVLEAMLHAEDTTWSAQFEAIIAQAALEAGAEMAAEFGLTIDFEKFPVQSVISKLKEGTLNLVRNINNTTRNQIRTIIANGIENHQSYTEVAKLIRQRFAEMAATAPQGHIRDRATLIAVDAIGQAYTDSIYAVAEAMAEVGMSMEKAWQTVDDDRVEAECAGNQAQGWIPLEAEFQSGDDSPLAHPGCRCALLIRRRP